MKINKISVYPLEYPEPHDSNKLRYINLVRVDSSDGTFGWGECISQKAEAALAVKVVIDRGFAPLLKDKDPADIRRLWELMRHHSSWYGTGGIATMAISALDIALHDLKGKALGVPIYQLLGGMVTPQLRAAASIIVDMVDLESTAREFAEYVARGYTAVKGGWGKNPDTAFGLNAQRDLLFIKMVRAVGTYVKWDVAHAIKMARQFEEYDLLWIEEPLPHDDFAGHFQLRSAIETLIATGEKAWTVQEFKRLIDQRVADVIMPDVGKAEGITGVKQIIDLAAVNNVYYNPHSWSSAINTAASLHLCASATNTLVFELKPNHNPMQHELVEQPIEHLNGYVKVPDKPGLGIIVKEDVVRKYAFT